MSFWRKAMMVGTALAVAGTASAQSRDPSQPSVGYIFIEEAEPTGAPPPRPQPTPEQIAAAEADLASYLSPTLTRFAGDEEFRRYLGALLAVGRVNGRYWAQSGAIQFAQAGQSDTVQPICPSSIPDCTQPVQPTGAEQVVVTGSRISAPSNPSITNNQMRGVDEGDIVKQIGRHLLMLQDGRIFVVDTRGGNGQRLALTDRMDVYRDARSAAEWYDEMLVFGDRILVTAYSYRERATELSVFRLSPNGRLVREGVFYMSSNDYYSAHNYATRITGGNLIVYTPFDVVDMTRPNFKWPVVRRWVDGESGVAADRRARTLFDAGQIYRPVRALDDPTVHTVSVCPLGPIGENRDMACRSTAFIAPRDSEWYVSADDAFLWVSDDRNWAADPCTEDQRFTGADFRQSLLYRVPVGGAAPSLIAARGTPPDQFALDSRNGRFRALLGQQVQTCREQGRLEGRGDDERRVPPDLRLTYFDVPLSRFGATAGAAQDGDLAAVPGVGQGPVASRFTETYVVYGSLRRYGRNRDREPPPAFAIPVGNPAGAVALPIHTNVVRAEQAGSDIVLTGYRAPGNGLVVTLIDLDRRPRVASQELLEGRYETEGRSHAFNSLIDGDGNGVMGLPTVSLDSPMGRAPWRSTASDLSFLTVDSRGRLHSVGELERRISYGNDDDDNAVGGYSCQVSCIDWYGNSRPIFTDGRIFALTGAELIEGRLAGDEIDEVQRLNLARAVPPRLAAR